jgi:endonuclease/exonuclease/phosphatase family metal-dependent hydrolase
MEIPAMILGTWNLEVYPPPHSRKGRQQVDALHHHDADLWFLTELHADLAVSAQAIHFSQPRDEANPDWRKATISTRWPIEPIPADDSPVEGRLAMARVYPPGCEGSVLAVCSVLPWRGATPHWRRLLGSHLTYRDVYAHLLDYVVRRIHAERQPGENVIWGGDFNQALIGRDYVGTLHGRAGLLRAFDEMELQVPTRDLPAKTVNHPAIDHIAIPAGWHVVTPPATQVPTLESRSLSDHALYLVETVMRPA